MPNENAKQIMQRYTNEDLEFVTEFLENYRDYTEETEPYATQSIQDINNTILGLPQSISELEH